MKDDLVSRKTPLTDDMEKSVLKYIETKLKNRRTLDDITIFVNVGGQDFIFLHNSTIRDVFGMLKIWENEITFKSQLAELTGVKLNEDKNEDEEL